MHLVNYNLLEIDNSHTNTFTDTMCEHKFHPTINKPTRITASSATVIDHIWTDRFNCEISSGIIMDSLADHLPVIQWVQLKSPQAQTVPHTKHFFFQAIMFQNL